MRRLHGGWLAAPLLLLATGCGAGGSDASGDRTAATEIEPAPALVVERDVDAPAAVETAPAIATDLRVLVVGVDVPGAPGLDAAVTTLLSRPHTAVVAAVAGDVAPAQAAADADATTMSGYPVRVLRGGIGDIVAGSDGLDARPDLVVVGISADDAVGTAVADSAAAAVARDAEAAGVPVIIVAAGGAEPDFAAAALELDALLDLDLDRLLLGGDALVLAVPSCESGMVRGRAEVSIGTAAPPAAVDCTPTDTAPLGRNADDVTAYGAGFATLAPLAG